MKRTCIIYFDVENDTYSMARDFKKSVPANVNTIGDVITSMLDEIGNNFKDPVIKSILFSESRDV